MQTEIFVRMIIAKVKVMPARKSKTGAYSGETDCDFDVSSIAPISNAGSGKTSGPPSKHRFAGRFGFYETNPVRPMPGPITVHSNSSHTSSSALVNV